MRYDYNESMEEDILNEIHENDEYKRNPDESRDDYAERLNEELWTCDSVTGNASGSYTFNAYKAQEYVMDNHDLLVDALREYDTPMPEVAGHFLDGDWEWFDVTIRCYLLGQVIEQVIDDLEAEAS